MHYLRRYHPRRSLSIRLAEAFVVWTALLAVSACASTEKLLGEARVGARRAPPGGASARIADAFGDAASAEVELQCLLPVALASPDTIRAPEAELAAFIESVRVAAGPAAARPDLVAEVESGRRAVANAAWWGYDPDDATEMLQAALDSPARAVVIPSVDGPWVTRPLELRSNLVLVLEEGAELVAKRGAFLDRTDTLMSADRAENIIIWGYGATVRMRKSDYSSWPYAESEWRHALSFRSVTNLGIFGVTTEDAGGDGIYLGRKGDEQPFCDNVVIRDVLLKNGNRQGLSVVSARRLLVERSSFVNTQGTLPQAGIDFEPNKSDERLEDIVLRESYFLRNRGAGIQFFLWNMTDQSVPISVRIEDSELRGNMLGLYVAPAGGDPSGRIVVSDTDPGWPRWVRTPPELEVVYE
jgi:hypothetical protein